MPFPNIITHPTYNVKCWEYCLAVLRDDWLSCSVYCTNKQQNVSEIIIYSKVNSLEMQNSIYKISETEDVYFGTSGQNPDPKTSRCKQFSQLTCYKKSHQLQIIVHILFFPPIITNNVPIMLEILDVQICYVLYVGNTFSNLFYWILFKKILSAISQRYTDQSFTFTLFNY